MTQTTIVNIERGKTVPNYQTMRRISTALGVDARQVFEFAEALEKDAA